jgi:hypothetical protein
MRLWGVYSDLHSEIELVGDRDGLRALATAAAQAAPLELALDEPRVRPQQDAHALHRIRLEPTDSDDSRIAIRREGATAVLSGNAAEVARIIGGSLAELAELPQKANGVWTHVHLDPTSDPERHYFAPGSGSLVVSYGDG